MRNPRRYSKRDLGGVDSLAPRGTGTSSFTLFEVVLSIAIIGFVLISILGLMSYTLGLVRQADRYAGLSFVASQMLATLESEPFQLSTSQASTNAVFYYTFEGLPTNSAGSYYQCTIANAAPSGFPLSATMQPIQISIMWQNTGVSGFANTNILVTSVLKYD